MAVNGSQRPEVEGGGFARDGEQIEDEEENELVIVLERTGAPIDECVVYEEPDGTAHTVDEWYQDDESYQSDEEGVVVVYQESIDHRFDEPWTVSEVMDAYKSGELTAGRGEGGYGIQTYTMPISRLTEIGGK